MSLRYNPRTIRRKIKQKFNVALENKSQCQLGPIREEGAYGHEAGTPVEHWAKRTLQSIRWSVRVYFPNEFLEKFLEEIGRDRASIERQLDKTWWAPLLVSEKQLRNFLAGRNVDRWQQEGGDIVLFYGQHILRNCNDLILLNAKSHALQRASRDPNIMSAQRLLEYFVGLLDREHGNRLLEASNIWFLGVNYKQQGSKGVVEDVHIRDLFRLDLSALPQINFDAAIQIQWHVENMVEINQSKLSFVTKLANEFLKRWRIHSRRKTEKYEALVAKIRRLALKAHRRG